MKKKLSAFIILTFLLSVITTVNPPIIHASSSLTLTVETNKQVYYLRENINIYGNLTLDGSPVQDELVALEIYDPIKVIAFRTLQSGNPPPGKISVVDLYSCKDEWCTNRKNRFKPEQTAYIKAAVKNTGINPKDVTITTSVYDGNNIPLGVGSTTQPVYPGTTVWAISSVVIPEWARIGNATMYASAWIPNGAPYCPERSAQFEIFRGASKPPGGLNPPIPDQPTGVTGPYNSTFKLSPEPWPGTYTVSMRSSHEEEQTTDSTIFQVDDAEYPPQASFTYSPPAPYVNQEVTFDASGSTAEGYGDYIVSYEWDFGDGTPEVTESDPITTHVYTVDDTYTVTLNVTDNEGLWCTTSKPVTILPAGPPTANFTYSPPTPAATGLTTFNATLSEPGWNGTHYVPIVSYEWDFGDGTPEVTESDPITTHVYATNDTYTVTLNVTDAQGKWDTASLILTVLLPYGPTASFTYLPPEPFFNGVVIFDASTSEPGWNGTTQPIVSYEWDFGDGTPEVTESDPITTHFYTVNGVTEMNLQNATFLNLINPMYSGWNEIYPVPGQTYNLTSWVDTDISGNLTVGDRIDFNGTLIEWYVVTLDYGAISNMTVYRSTYTVTLNVTDAQGHWNTTSKTLILSIATELHDVAVTNITLSATDAYPTWITPLYINVTIKNNGTRPENFTVTAYNNTTPIDTKSVTNLPAGGETTLTFTWDIPDIPKAYPYPAYTISANASAVPGEVDATNNHLSDGAVTVRWPGDADREPRDMQPDGHVNLVDLSALAGHWFSIPTYHPAVDFNMDGLINLSDLSILADNWFQGPLD